MPPSDTTDQIMAILQTRLGDRLDQYLVPPPVFKAMQAEFQDFDAEKNSLSVRFPVLGSWLNPYGMVQGGMVAAAIDNAIGPLSVLVAPPNVTRHMELKYSRAVTSETEFITVTAWLVEQDGRWLTFKAEARNPEGQRLTRAKAVHWILET